MIIKLSPQLRTTPPPQVSKSGDALTIDGETFDFSSLPEGGSLSVASPWIVGPVRRSGGEIRLTLLLPHGHNATTAQTFPEEIESDTDGAIVLPVDPVPEPEPEPEPLTPEQQLQLARLNMVVTPFKARAALYREGLLDEVEAIMADPSTDREVVLAWEYAQEFKRTSPMIAAIAQLLNLTDSQIDDLFTLASSIDA